MDTTELGFEFHAMGTACRIRLAGCNEQQAQAAADAAIAEVRRIETKYSRYRDDSIVSRINAAAGSGVPIEAQPAVSASERTHHPALAANRFLILVLLSEFKGTHAVHRADTDRACIPL